MQSGNATAQITLDTASRAAWRMRWKQLRQ
jgi:hypothetical protein